MSSNRSFEYVYKDGRPKPSLDMSYNIPEDPQLQHATEVAIKLAAGAKHGLLRLSHTSHPNGDFEYVAMYKAYDEEPQISPASARRKRRTRQHDEETDDDENRVGAKCRRGAQREAKNDAKNKISQAFEFASLDLDDDDNKTVPIEATSSEQASKSSSAVYAAGFTRRSPGSYARGSNSIQTTITSSRARRMSLSRSTARDRVQSSSDSSPPPRAAAIRTARERVLSSSESSPPPRAAAIRPSRVSKQEVSAEQVTPTYLPSHETNYSYDKSIAHNSARAHDDVLEAATTASPVDQTGPISTFGHAATASMSATASHTHKRGTSNSSGRIATAAMSTTASAVDGFGGREPGQHGQSMADRRILSECTRRDIHPVGSDCQPRSVEQVSDHVQSTLHFEDVLDFHTAQRNMALLNRANNEISNPTEAEVNTQAQGDAP